MFGALTIDRDYWKLFSFDVTRPRFIVIVPRSTFRVKSTRSVINIPMVTLASSYRNLENYWKIYNEYSSRGVTERVGVTKPPHLL